MAMLNYYDVARTVEPKRKKVADAEKQLRIATKDLADTKAALEALAAQLASLSKQYEEKSAELRDLKEKADLMERRLAAAEKLISGLASERERCVVSVLLPLVASPALAAS